MGTSADTKHNHPGPYGFVACPADCPRGLELAAGAAPRRPTWTDRLRTPAQRDAAAAAVTADLHAHFASDKHRRECKPVCTYGEW